MVFPELYAHRTHSDKTFAPAPPVVPVFTGRDPYASPELRFHVHVSGVLFDPKGSAVRGNKMPYLQ